LVDQPLFVRTDRGHSYGRELGVNPLDLLTARIGADGVRDQGVPVRWLDLCCGTGRALIQAADQLDRAGLGQ
jgi:hypothetical protein